MTPLMLTQVRSVMGHHGIPHIRSHFFIRTAHGSEPTSFCQMAAFGSEPSHRSRAQNTLDRPRRLQSYGCAAWQGQSAFVASGRSAWILCTSLVHHVPWIQTVAYICRRPFGKAQSGAQRLFSRRVTVSKWSSVSSKHSFTSG